MDGSNWYVYCSNNPLCFVDPTGLEGDTFGNFALSYTQTTWYTMNVKQNHAFLNDFYKQAMQPDKHSDYIGKDAWSVGSRILSYVPKLIGDEAGKTLGIVINLFKDAKAFIDIISRHINVESQVNLVDDVTIGDYVQSLDEFNNDTIFCVAEITENQNTQYLLGFIAVTNTEVSGTAHFYDNNGNYMDSMNLDKIINTEGIDFFNNYMSKIDSINRVETGYDYHFDNISIINEVTPDKILENANN